MSIDSVIRVPLYERDGQEVTTLDRPFISVENHRVYDDRVVLVIDGKRMTVLSADLSAAIRNATNRGAR